MPDANLTQAVAASLAVGGLGLMTAAWACVTGRRTRSAHVQDWRNHEERLKHLERAPVYLGPQAMQGLVKTVAEGAAAKAVGAHLEETTHPQREDVAVTVRSVIAEEISGWRLDLERRRGVPPACAAKELDLIAQAAAARYEAVQDGRSTHACDADMPVVQFGSVVVGGRFRLADSAGDATWTKVDPDTAARFLDNGQRADRKFPADFTGLRLPPDREGVTNFASLKGGARFEWLGALWRRSRSPGFVAELISGEEVSLREEDALRLQVQPGEMVRLWVR